MDMYIIVIIFATMIQIGTAIIPKMLPAYFCEIVEITVANRKIAPPMKALFDEIER